MSDRFAPTPLPRRIVRTFFSPGELFREIRQGTPPWAGPLAVSILAAMVVVAAMPQDAFVALTEHAVNRRGEPVQVTSDPAAIARYGRMLGMIVALVRQPLTAFALAGALALVSAVLLRGRASYLQYLAVTTHALLITALGSLLAAGIALVRGGQPERVSLATLVPAFAPGTLGARILEGVDLFTVWALLFAALGISAINGSRSWRRAAGVLVGAYLATALVLAVVAA